MAETNINHHCIVCGTGYHACDTCQEIKGIAPWRAYTDTVEHYKIFSVLQDYNGKKISAEDAKTKLDNCDITGWESFKESSASLIRKILATETKKVAKTTKTTKKSKKAENDDEK